MPDKYQPIKISYGKFSTYRENFNKVFFFVQMLKFHAKPVDMYNFPTQHVSLNVNLEDIIDNWNSIAVAEWLQGQADTQRDRQIDRKTLSGVDEGLHSVLPLLYRANITGQRLFLMTDDNWKNIGVKNIGLRHAIASAVQLLARYVRLSNCLLICLSVSLSVINQEFQIESIDTENAQWLALLTSVAAKNLQNELAQKTRTLEILNSLFSCIGLHQTDRQIDRQTNRQTDRHFFKPMQNLCASISELVSASKRLMAWLDGPPFLPKYSLTRDCAYAFGDYHEYFFIFLHSIFIDFFLAERQFGLIELIQKLLKSTQIPMIDMLRQKHNSHAIKIVC